MGCRHRRRSGLKSGGSWIPVRKISIFQANFKKNRFFPGNFTQKIRFSKQVSEEIGFLSGNFIKKFDFPGKNFRITTFSVYPDKIDHLQLLYFWTNYSMSLQKPPLSNILPEGLLDKIIIISRPPQTPLQPSTTPKPKI